MTVTVDFETPQVQVGDGVSGIEISPIIIPYSIRDTEDPLQYLGGQVALTTEDTVSFSDNTAAWYEKALAKIKDMVGTSEVYVSAEPIENEKETVQEEPIADETETIAEEPIVGEKTATSEEPILNEEEEAQDEQ